jgi:ureidoacrylate peracid hydrolase
MHTPEIDPTVVARVIERRGSVHVFDHIDPTRTAHVIVDLQNGFMAPGAICEIAAAREIVPAVNRISAAVRAAGGLVIYLQNTFDAEAIAAWKVFFEHFCSPERRAGMIEAFSPGNSGHDIYPDLEIDPQDVLVWKRRYGAFVPGSSSLHAILQARGIETLIITGTASNVCCESTARDGMMLNYKILFVSDANATFTDALHNATLTALAHSFADIVSTTEVLSLLAAQPALAAAAE